MGLAIWPALGLRWMDVDLHTGRLWVRQQLVAVDGDIEVGEPGLERLHAGGDLNAPHEP